jgi:hypothetical protein
MLPPLTSPLTMQSLPAMAIEPLPPLPLAVADLPQGLARFGNPAAPLPAKLMAAQGAVPVTGVNQAALLCQLSGDAEDRVRTTALESLRGLPEEIALSACAAELHPSLLDALHEHLGERPAVLEALIQNRALADYTLERIARKASEKLGERIALNQQRLLGCPEIIEALYKNKNVRMSTADRLVELAARHDLDLKGIPAYRAHVEAIRGQLIFEPCDEPLPGDEIFQEALAEDADDASVIDADEEGVESVKEKFVPLSVKIRNMTLAEKIRLAMVGDAAARALLVRDPVRQVSYAAITSPAMREDEAVAIAASKEVSEDVLRYIGNKREWLKGYEIKKALTFNPKVPVGVSLRFLPHLRPNDLKGLARSRGIPGPLKTAARQRIEDQAKVKKK